MTPDYWDTEETEKEKLERIKKDKFINKYSMFKNIDKIIPIIQSDAMVYSNKIMKEIRFNIPIK